MKAKEFLANVDKGFYHEARRRQLTPGQFLAQEVEPDEAHVQRVFARLLKRYRTEDNGSFQAQAIYAHAEETAALEACFHERQIRSRGPASDTAEKAFFSSENDTALFPTYLSNRIISGLLAGSLVPRLAATEERVDSQVAEKITMSDTEGDRQLKYTGEGSGLPKTKISRSEGSVYLFKYGRLLEWTYETARRMRLNIMSVFLERMGAQIAIDETNDLIEVLIAGDGTASSAVTDTDAEVSGTLDYDELIRLTQAFPAGYRLSDAVINDTNLRTILNMAEYKDPQIRVRFQEQGDVEALPILGGTFHRWTSTGSTSFSTDRILAVDNRYAVATLVEGDMLEESDQLIDRQVHRRALSYWKGYMKLDTNATQCLDITA